MSKKTHIEAMQLLSSYATEHPETADLIDMFIRMRKHPKASIKMRLGTETEDGFASYLTSNLRFPKIKFSHWENKPLILIQNHSETIASLNIARCNILHSEKVAFCAVYQTKKETY